MSVAEGAEFAPGDMIGVLFIGRVTGPFSGPTPIIADSFGRVTKVLVSSDAMVRPGEPPLEFEERPVTEAEYLEQRRRADLADVELDRIKGSLGAAITTWWRHWRWRRGVVKQAFKDARAAEKRTASFQKGFRVTDHRPGDRPGRT
jgi:hypothetical protein